MKQHIWKSATLAVAASGILLLAGCSGGTNAYGTTSAPTTQSSVAGNSSADALMTGQSTLGTIVVNGQGFTAYVFDHDTANSGVSTCSGACQSLWPPITSATPTPVVTGITGTVATITRSDGAKQVTINGLPLYTYTPDTKPGDDTGQGFGGIWWVVGANGSKITAQATPSTSPSSGYSSNGY